MAETIDPTFEEEYWRENFRREPYYAEGKDFADYGPAYQMSVERYPSDCSFEETEASMADDWNAAKRESTLHWLQARAAAKAAWDRLHHRSKPEVTP
jgi:hypothetical protein